MFGRKSKPTEKVTVDRTKFEGKAARTVADLQQRLEAAEHQLRLKDAELQSRDDRIQVLEELVNVLRDSLESHQITAQVHTAEGKILLSNYAAPQGNTNGSPTIRR